jgi:macrolide transport system ATP-binding/permease protein
MIWQNLREFVLRIAGIFRKKRREAELSEELEFHLALKQSRYQADGAASSDGSYQARRDFAGLERWKERCRDARGMRPLEDFERDLQLGVRVLRKAPIFTRVAIQMSSAGNSPSTM